MCADRATPTINFARRPVGHHSPVALAIFLGELRFKKFAGVFDWCVRLVFRVARVAFVVGAKLSAPWAKSRGLSHGWFEWSV